MNIERFLSEHENKSLLRFLTCGSVDDGKSTLIGRLLYDSKLLFDDQLSALKRDSVREGNAGEGEIDYALLLDGLKAEREQGITIDVAYRYFTTPHRKFIIADTPGHEQYTRNMATGASSADLAIILIDARKGVITQTRRHSFIVSLLGIRHVVVAVNKMDLVDFSQARFEEIRADFEALSKELAIPDIRFVPLSALKGDNVVDPSPRIPWYSGPSLLNILETVDISSDRNLGDFRFPVQFVSRPNLDFRGFAGSVVSGVIRKGDRIKALPSLKESTIKRIVTADGDLAEAFAPQAVTLELNDEIDISVGEMIVHAENIPHVATHFEAMILWLSETPMNRNTTYLLRHTSHTTKARITGLEYSVDVNTMEKKPAGQLQLNGIGRANITTHQPLFFDAYRDSRETGSFILIDPISNNTVAAGMIERPQAEGERAPLEAQVDRREFLWERGLVSPEARIGRNQHRGKTVLFVGPASGGKQDLARRLELKLFDKGLQAYYLGVPSLLEGLDADIGQNFRDRDEHIRRIGELARIMTDAGLIFISSLERADEYDLQRLKILNSPNELFVVS
ncbi:MAG TPA: sulfate adenylyltransferase subunit CysN, partial [Pontiellaceae bacterium]|nr:sulfate adenylyltransferase subunit CysN [Pontiellaceae bacterium]